MATSTRKQGRERTTVYNGTEPFDDKTDWARIDAMTDDDIKRQITENPDAAPLTTTLTGKRRTVHNADAAPNAKAIRTRLGMSQSEFARTFGLPLDALKQWEQHRREPAGTARTLLLIIDREPDAVRRAVAAVD
jgi:putative transcriptional regulator